MDSGVHVLNRTAAVTAEDLGHDELGGRGHARDAGVVLAGAGDAAHVRAVAFVVERRRGLAAAAAVGEGHGPARQVLVAGVDAGIDDADARPGPERAGPR